jgi:PAS domain-containing protein
VAESNPPDDLELLRAIAALAADAPDPFAGALVGAITAQMPGMLVLLDPAARILWLNRANTGTVADYLGRSVLEFATPGERAEIRATFDRVLATGQVDRFVGHGPGKRGPASRYESWVAPIIRAGTVLALVLVTRDVSEAWELYEQLRDREQRLSLVLEAAGMGTWRFDWRTMTVDLDERARAIYGLAESRLPSRTFTSTRIHPEDREAGIARRSRRWPAGSRTRRRTGSCIPRARSAGSRSRARR